MSRLRRMPYTKPLPEGAEIVTHKAKPHARWLDGGKPALAPLTRSGDRIRLLSAKWYGEYRDESDTLKCVPLSTDKTAAAQMLAELVRKVELRRANISDPHEAHRKRPLAEHVADWKGAMEAEDSIARHVRQTVNAVSRALTACRFVFLADVQPSRLQEHLAGLRRGKALPPLEPGKESFTKAEAAAALGIKHRCLTPLIARHQLPATGNGKARRFPRETVEHLRAHLSRGSGVRSTNFDLGAVKAFFRWMVRDRRAPDSPVAHLRAGNAAADRRRQRRPLSADELRALIDAARQSGSVFRGLAGTDRAALYSLAAGTGFRAEELSTLRPASFSFDADPPTVSLRPEDSKNGRGAVQPLAPDLARTVRAYLTKPCLVENVWP